MSASLIRSLECLYDKLKGQSESDPSFVSIVAPEKVGRTHQLVSSVNSSVPSGMKSVVINNLTGVTSVIPTEDGGVAFELGDGRRPTTINFDATTVDPVTGLLPEIQLVAGQDGGTWQWVALKPIKED